ncbi:MAG TPA: geranylgeranylglycerol-phosphate geranylgeranyltransferase [Edaphocola sp.]|nr:geranylgeranylglycerol-phosphate geranylgeranyltransferase [Edaphocola sp.]
MNVIKDWLRTVRAVNLIIIILSQMLCWFCLIKPFELFTNETLFLNFNNALLLSMATAMIAASGYIINDYFDVKIDAINKPEKSLKGRGIKSESTIFLYVVFNLIGLSIFGNFAFQLNNFYLILLPLSCIIVLWFYSALFKRKFIVGNIVVAALTAFTLLILIAFEPSVWTYLPQAILKNNQGINKLNPLWILIIYSVFAFLLNWIREIIKDIEDIKGDAADGCVTMPIKIGIGPTVRIVRMLLLLTISILIISGFLLFREQEFLLTVCLILLVIVPLFLIFEQFGKSQQIESFNRYSNYLKLIMILGITILVVIYFSQYYNLFK